MRIDKLELRNFRGIDKMSLKFDPRLTVITGVNGSGKSSILDAVAMTCANVLSMFSLSDTEFGEPRDVKIGSKRASIKADFHFLGSPYLSVISPHPTSRGSIGVNPGHKEPGGKAGRYGERLDAELNSPDFTFPVAAYYRSNRYVLEVPVEPIYDFTVVRRDAYKKALSDRRIDFHDLFKWFRNIEDEENEERVRDPKYRRNEMRAVRTAVEQVTGFSEMQVRRRGLYIELDKRGTALDLRSLSDGEKCFVALVADLARRCAIANPAMENPLHSPGLVMIDEIELHTHPELQRRMVGSLMAAFPNCQFIITTHSPQVLGEIQPGKVILLKEGDKGIEAIRLQQSYGLDSNLMLESIMGAPSRDPGVSAKISELYDLLDAEDYGKVKRKLRSLKKEINGSLPEFIEIETEMTMLTELKNA